ncbi:MAG: glycerol-3-phosphate dehydrogenase subunit GlpB [Vibrio sp.]
MMNYDVIIIGSGIAGYSAGLKCLEHGLKTAIVSSGQSALHFSSGSIDLLSHSPRTHQAVSNPWDEIAQLAESQPNHPYAKLGTQTIRDAMSWYQTKMEQAGLSFAPLPSQQNHFRITTIGTLKSTWLSQEHVAKIETDFSNLNSFKKVVMVSIDGFRDFQPQIAKSNLEKHPAFKELPIKIVKVNLSAFGRLKRNPYDLRSIDISHLLMDDNQFQEFADQLLKVATSDDLVILPAVLSSEGGIGLMKKLKDYTGLTFHQVPTMPPSLLGIRIEDVMKSAFINHGGVLHKGDEVLGGKFVEQDGKLALKSIQSKKMGDIDLIAKHYILASGSFFSKGLSAGQFGIHESIFGLDTEATGERESWHQAQFFTKKPHPYLSFGVVTDAHFKPMLQGQAIYNLYCVGAILSGYDPIVHGCGGGVAISTAYSVVKHIVADAQDQKSVKEVIA